MELISECIRVTEKVDSKKESIVQRNESQSSRENYPFTVHHSSINALTELRALSEWHANDPTANSMPPEVLSDGNPSRP
jgi:hypothetical protein